MDKSKWEYKKLEVDNLPIGDVFDIFMGRTPSRDDLSLWEDGNHEWVSIGDMGSTKYISETKEKVSDIACANMRLVPKDTVIMSFKLSIGKVAITEIPLYTNEAIMAFPPKPGYNILPNYLYYHLQAYKWQSANRAVMGKTLNKAVISSSHITIPDSETQQRIVAELDCLNEMIALKQEQLKEFDKFAQSIFYDMFGDPIANDKGWGLRLMKDVCYAIGDGLHGTPQYDEKGTVAFINGNNLVDGKIVITERTQFVNETEAKKIFVELDTNTVLLSINGTLGKTAVYNNEKVVLGKSACYLRLSKLLDVNFVISLMNTKEFMDYLENNSSKSTIKNVGLKAIRNFPIILPPLALQQQFAEKIQAIEAQKELVKKSIAETQHLLDSRMDFYFN